MSHHHQEAVAVSDERTITHEVDEKHTYEFKSINDIEVSSQEHTPPELVAAEKSLLWKLDFLYVMPCIAVLNFLQVQYT